QTIRWRLTVAFVSGGCFVALLVAVAISAHFEMTDLAARTDAMHVAELMAETVVDSHGFKPNLQREISHLHSVQGRDFVIVDTHQKGLADAHPDEVGKIYVTDPKDEVGQTISDGKIRTFVERLGNRPEGTHQMVVPIRQGASIIGAVVLEYTPLKQELLYAGRNEFYLVASTGIATLLLVMFFGIRAAGRISKPLTELKDSVVRIAAHDYAARVVVTSHDEIGILGAAFNKMAEDLGSSHAQLVEFNEKLERKVSERTQELRDAALASLNMMADAIREREDAEQTHKKLDYLAYYDALTGLANRSLFLERVAQHLREAQADGHRLALFLIDLERFKNINDSLGQLAGDDLLKQVAQWLERNVGDASMLARVEADHFAVVLPEVGDDAAVGSFIATLMNALLVQPFRLNDAVYRIAAKAGIAVFPNDGDNADPLFKHAEAALKQAKSHGDRYLSYTRAMTDSLVGKPNLESQLRQALDNEEYVLHYQPKVDLISGKLTGAEALIRWNDPRTGLVPPFKFIPILEETGLIYEIGRWAMQKAIADYMRWLRAGLMAPRIAVNVSPLQLRHRGFVAEVERAISVDAYAPAGLELEITESMVMEDIKQSIASLNVIRALGVSIAIDDFGTGFSSLGYLAKLPVDTLKIDRSFVIGMTESAQGLSLVSTIIGLAHSMNLKVVGEGVETEEQARQLRVLQCDQMQGYLFSKPVPAEIFEAKFLIPGSTPPSGT
ncbi:MAG TPA: EAL domain-containing protein, partial [Xanthomonadaceae bacterium]|nr:EAL domain-containing protein [Xanthomonadaceae bacterium]